MVEMDTDRELERIAKAAQDIAAELEWEFEDIDADLVAEILINWAIDSQSRDALIFQIAAAQEFGAQLSEYAQHEIAKLGINPAADFSEERAILRHIHESRERREMTLYRGTDHDETNALESWTTSREAAEFYIKRNEGGQVIERTFSADEILGTWQDGIGLECADEVVIINR